MRIPKQHVAGLVVIARFSETDTTEVLSALSDPELHDIEETSVALAKRLGTFTADEIERALWAVTSLANVRADFGTSIQDFVEDLSRSMQADQNKELRLKTEQQNQFKGNLSRLLADDGLIIASKIVYLKRDYEHTFCRARILTDIRPVYGEDRTVPPSAAIIVHILQLIYHENRTTKEIHIALEENSIAALKTQLERAEQKAKSLKALLDSTKVRVVLG